MDAYEKIIKIIRNQGAVKNPIGLQLAEMTDATSCDVGELHLEAEDLLISQHLTDYETEIELSGNKRSAKIYGHLKKGDVVLIQRMSDEKYVIIEKLLEEADEG